MFRSMLYGIVSFLVMSALGCSRPHGETSRPTFPTEVRVQSPEEEALTFVENWGGTIKRDSKLPGNPVVELNMDRMSDPYLKKLAIFKDLTLLDLGSTKVTDVGLKEIANFKKLTSLILSSTEITDAGLKELAILPELNSLNLNYTKVTDAGLKELATFKKRAFTRICG
jgi:internalin A